MIMKILITGANGMLGVELVKLLSHSYHVTGVDVGECDICDPLKLKIFIKETKPAVIINCAAYTDVEGCERNREKAFNVNAEGIKNLALISSELKIKLIHISTDYVFDGSRERTSGYYEYDLTSPINEYGRSKLKGENYLREIDDRYTIVRTSWLFGHARENFVSWILKNCLLDKTFRVIDDLSSTPTFTVDIAICIEKVIEKDISWIIHASNTETTTKFDIARYISKKIKKGNIQPGKSSELNWTAKRPSNSSLENFVLKVAMDYEFPPWYDAVDRFIKGYN